jgi:hypothetical protein
MRLALSSSLATLVLVLAAVVPSAAVATPAAHQGLPGADDGRLGTVHFATSCDPTVQEQFDYAVAAYHSFWFVPARRAFEAVLAADPTCAIAHWGVALTWFGNPFAAPVNREALAQGWAAVQQATAVGARTPRERGFVAAVDALYRDFETRDHWTRLVAYQEALADVYRAYPEDREAAVFYALALAATTPPTDKTYTNSLRAAEILEEIWAEHPNHPGVAHYLIHSYDYPPLAQQGLYAAERYGAIAPAAPHALHMPSHTFTRVGYWQESIASNLASAAASEPGPAARLHPWDYLTYAYLQGAQDDAARGVLDELRGFPEIGAPNFGNAYALAAIPARYALERGRWDEAAALALAPASYAWDRFPAAEAIVVFARGLGAARSGNLADAHGDLARLEALRDALLRERDTYWAEQVELQRQVVAAWVAHAEGRHAEAVELMRAAAALEDTTEKAAVTPGPIVPARELLGDLLLVLGDSRQALEAFATSERAEPNRFRGLYGAARAAALAGEPDTARTYYARLLDVSAQADTVRPELQEARAFLARP